MQSFNDMVMGLSHVFTYLNIKELVIASKVCSSWNMISKDKRLVRNFAILIIINSARI